ncbi:MAG: ubiquitinyl hydrolase 1 [Vezdaea acicularis]|nr:MAG: ubiquitinyl hydrolase 1 [Vezdaea acicularis]
MAEPNPTPPTITTTATTEDPNPTNPTPRKRFVPLENNPEVMTTLTHTLGLTPTLSFHDVWDLNSPDLLAFIPRPAHALLMVFPTGPSYTLHRTTEDAPLAPYTGHGPSEPVVWYKQTIGNACGLIGLLHAISNGATRALLAQDSPMAKLLAEAIPLTPEARADLLYNSDLLESAHADAASRGDSRAPPAEEEVELHYVCFAKGSDGHLWELDGARKGPLDRGVLAEDEDVLSERGLDLGARKFLEREIGGGEGDVRFSVLALAPTLD